MKFSESWLREWVNPAISTEALVEQITMAGLEVDGVDPVAGEFSGVLVGEVVECGQHPDADKLRVTKIDVGADELLDIVCGAPNCRQGLKVAVATVGAVLPGNFKIKKAKLRGQPSFGMLCSFSELGMSDDHDGILELPLDAPVGQDLREYLQLNDHVIEVDLTPNRMDCLGIKGLATEVGVLNQTEVTPVTVTAVEATIEDQISVSLEAPEACPRYLARVIKGVDVKATSPLWLTEKLRRCGVRAIDPVVDVTNYVLLELGHPMHAFDLSQIDSEIRVRLATQDEEMTLLDENTVKLNDNTLVIADAQKPLAMAGIFGGLNSGVTEETQDILLESAFFAPLAIAGRARQYGLHTDASHRYERGVDPLLQHQAMERATQLLLEIVGGQAGPVVEAKSEQHLPKEKSVSLRKQRLAHILGAEIADEQVSDILTRLGFSVTFNGSVWEVVVPPLRFDISIEEDLIEEVARIYGYNNIANTAPLARLTMNPADESKIALANLKESLVNRGYQEAITYSFVDPKIQSLLFPDLQGLVLPHPISADMSVMRVSCWPGLLQTVSYNQKRQQQRVRVFESGLRFLPDAQSPGGVFQQPVIAGVISGNLNNEHWTGDDQKVDFYDIKADVEALLAQTNQSREYRFEAAQHSALHPGQTAAIYLGEDCVGYVGAVHPQFEKALGLNGRTFVFELVLSGITTRCLPKASETSKFPANRRDIAIVVDDSVPANNILSCIEKFGGNQLVDLNLFDVYKGKGVEEGKKSLAIAITLQDTSRTLEENEIQEAVDRIVAMLSESFEASLRI